MIIKFLLLMVVFATLFTPITVLAQSPSVYSGVYTEGDIATFEQDAGKGASLKMFFQAWNAGNFPTDKMNEIRSHGSIPVVSWQSYDPDNGSTSWANIGDGKMDDYITQWARDSKTWGHPYFLRFDWEMNGYWEPNSAQSDKYVYMWKHVHDIFIKEGATNVTWVWCPNIDGPSTRPFDQMYPGNDYVDWVCMDGYNFGNTQSWGNWLTFNTVFGPTYNHLLRLAPGKPIMIAEMSSSEQGGSKADWISDMLNTQLPKNFPNIKAFVWFNINKEADWRIESSDIAREAYSSGISSGYYASNAYGDLSTSPIPYLGSLSAQIAPATPKPTLKPATPKPTVAPTKSPEPTTLASTTPLIMAEVSKNPISGQILDKLPALVVSATAILGMLAVIMSLKRIKFVKEKRK